MKAIGDCEKRLSVRSTQGEGPIRPRQINNQPERPSCLLNADQAIWKIRRPALTFGGFNPEPIAVRQITKTPILLAVRSPNESIGRIELVLDLRCRADDFGEVSARVPRVTAALRFERPAEIVQRPSRFPGAHLSQVPVGVVLESLRLCAGGLFQPIFRIV